MDYRLKLVEKGREFWNCYFSEYICDCIDAAVRVIKRADDFDVTTTDDLEDAECALISFVQEYIDHAFSVKVYMARRANIDVSDLNDEDVEAERVKLWAKLKEFAESKNEA